MSWIEVLKSFDEVDMFEATLVELRIFGEIVVALRTTMCEL